jgi:hypothetical protein
MYRDPAVLKDKWKPLSRRKARTSVSDAQLGSQNSQARRTGRRSMGHATRNPEMQETWQSSFGLWNMAQMWAWVLGHLLHKDEEGRASFHLVWVTDPASHVVEAKLSNLIVNYSFHFLLGSQEGIISQLPLQTGQAMCLTLANEMWVGSHRPGSETSDIILHAVSATI